MRVRVRFGGRCPGGGKSPTIATPVHSSSRGNAVVDAIISLVRDQIVRVSASDVEQDQTFQTESRVQNQNFLDVETNRDRNFSFNTEPKHLVPIQYNTMQCNAIKAFITRAWSAEGPNLSCSSEQSCPWVGLTHGLGRVGSRFFSVVGGLCWVGSTIENNIKTLK